MSELAIQTPTLNDKDWRLFEQGRDQNNIGLISQLRIDATLRKIRIAAADMTSDQLTELAQLAEEHLRIGIEQTDYDVLSDPLEYFHLKTKHALIEQIVFAQHVFSKKELFNERRELADGTYGMISQLLEEALHRLDATSKNNNTERSRLIGAINELTALALLQHAEKPERLAIPSDVTSDLYNATDLELFTLPKGRKKARVYHTQVKSRPSINVKMPFGGVLITADDMLNSRTNRIMFPTSRAIVNDVNATDTNSSASHLNQAIPHFESRLGYSIAKADIELDAFERLPVRLKRGVTEAMGNIITRLVTENPDASNLDVSIYEPDK